jgi:membrane protease YdiL (CAAX protease family)
MVKGKKGIYLVKAVLFCTCFTLLFVGLSALLSFFPGIQRNRLVYGLTGVLAGVMTTAGFLWFDKQTFASIGLRVEIKTLLRFISGVFIGIALTAPLAIGSLYAEHATIHLNNSSGIGLFLASNLALLPMAMMEEIGFRGYPLVVLQKHLGIRTAMILTSLLFAVYHIANGWSIASSFYGPAIWGMLFALSAVRTGGIAMATGIHFAANLCTSAFNPGAAPIWTVTLPDHVPEKTTTWMIFLPAFILLVIGVAGMEICVQKKVRFKRIG